jgi:hypothetical protein
MQFPMDTSQRATPGPRQDCGNQQELAGPGTRIWRRNYDRPEKAVFLILSASPAQLTQELQAEAPWQAEKFATFTSGKAQTNGPAAGCWTPTAGPFRIHLAGQPGGSEVEN